MAQGFRVTYATLSADNEEMHRGYEAGIETARSWLGGEHPFCVNGELRTGIETIIVADHRCRSIARVNLQRRLRCQHGPRTRPDANRLLQRVAGKYARTRTDDHHDGRTILIEGADAIWRFRVRVREDCAAATHFEIDFQTRTPADDGGGPGIW